MSTFTVKKPFHYGGRAYRSGDAIKLDGRDARTLLAIRKIEPAKEQPKRAAPRVEKKETKPTTYKTRRIKAEDTD